VRTDVIMVASLDPATGRAALFSIPRNMVQVPFPDGAGLPYREWPEMINALYGYGTANPQLFPGGNDPGANALKSAIGALLGIPIHYYAMVNMQGFVEVVNALGGVTIDVQFPMQVRLSPPGPGDEWRIYDIPAGRQHLDGYAALAYARSRTGNSDYHRMHRQRCVLGAVAREADPAALLLAFPTLAEVIKGHVQTDIPLELLPELIRLGDGLDTSQLIVVGFVPPTYTAGFAAGYPIPNVPLIQQRVQQAFSDAADQQPGYEQVIESCGWTGD
jgi:LCP family protein required for cell wall assembly